MDFLLEIGTEELPARFMEPGLTQMKELGEEMLQANRVSYQIVKTYGTPRRLALYIYKIGAQQTELVEEVKGPPKSVAFDEAGNPTEAALGFARGQGVMVTDLVIRETPVGKYVFARKCYPGRPTREVLAEHIPRLITSLSFPKPMRWADRELKFARPIRWLLSLLDEEIVDFELDGLKSGRITYGARFFVQEPITLQRPEEYFEKLREAFVVVDQTARKKMIWEMAQHTAAQAEGKIQPNQELLKEVTYLLEFPTPFCGSFSVRFLKLPPEVIVTPMQEYQRYFPIWNDRGKLLPKFIGFANGPVADLDLVREGNEKVLRARLQDAEFFYEEDLKTPLEASVEKLKTVVFLEGLGTIYDKVQRLVVLSRYLGSVLKLTENQRLTAERAAFLAKADLATNMVYEFPELQGVVGAEYARVRGERKEVCQAIREHYQPRFSGDEVPETKPGAVVALADKIDNLVGCFALGLGSTGSQDPYALRRQALGICHITLIRKFDFSLSELITQAYRVYGEQVEFKVSLVGVQESLWEFFRIRLRNLFIDQGYAHDIVEAALGPTHDRLSLVRTRLEALAALYDTPEFDALFTAYVRAANLARNTTHIEVDPSLFEEEEEWELYRAWKKIKREVERHVRKEEFQQALLAGAHLSTPVDRFFEGVMVMVEDENLRNNRLALLKDIAITIGQLGNLGKIVR